MSKEFDYDSWQAKMIALEIANEVGRGILKSLADYQLYIVQVITST